MAGETLRAKVERLVGEYALRVPPVEPLSDGLSLKDDFELESLSLVSLTVRLGEELGADVLELGVELGGIQTLGDLMKLADALAASGASNAGNVAGAVD